MTTISISKAKNLALVQNRGRFSRSGEIGTAVMVNRMPARGAWHRQYSEEVYLHDYATVEEAIEALKIYFVFYNTEWQHQSLDYQTPQEVYEAA